MTSRTDNSVFIDAPLELVWRITNDIRSWPTLFTEYAAVDVLHEEGDTIRFRLTMHPDEEGTVWSWVSERTMDPRTRTARAHRVETGPFEFMKLYWEYLPENGGTRMRWQQEFTVKESAPFDEAGATKHINENTLTQMAVIKKKVEAAAAAQRTTPDLEKSGR
jgi:aromatase